jgi:hypothetical protein
VRRAGPPSPEIPEGPEIPPVVRASVGRYLAAADAALPDLVDGFYLVGSAAQRAFQVGRSDIDFVAVTSRPLSAAEIDRLRARHRSLFAGDWARTVSRLPWRWPLMCNGVYVCHPDLRRPPAEVRPQLGHVAGRFRPGAAFDVNPVTWELLATRAIPVRGPGPSELAVPRDDPALRRWTRGNLTSYWARWARDIRRRGWSAVQSSTAQSRAWGVLGAPRLHATIATGRILSKEQAGEYALDTFEPRWHPLIGSALAYWRGASGGPYRPTRSRRPIADYVDMVVASGLALPSARPPSSPHPATAASSKIPGSGGHP